LLVSKTLTGRLIFLKAIHVLQQKFQDLILLATPESGLLRQPPEGRGPGGLPAGGVVTPSEGKLQGIPKARRVI
jgi:hypothetical protein